MTKSKKLLLAFSLLTLFLAVPLSSPHAQTRDNNYIYELPRTGGTPQVTSQQNTAVTELPRTGIPALAWAVALLAPLGVKMLKKKKPASELKPSDIWISRELDK